MTPCSRYATASDYVIPDDLYARFGKMAFNQAPEPTAVLSVRSVRAKADGAGRAAVPSQVRNCRGASLWALGNITRVDIMKLPRFVWIVLLMLAALCCWLTIPPAPIHGIRSVKVSSISLRNFRDASTAPVTGVYVNPQFLTALHMLEQRANVEALDEPEAVVVVGSGFDAGYVNRIYSVEKLTFNITNR
jgi:hypothetical protein